MCLQYILDVPLHHIYMYRYINLSLSLSIYIYMCVFSCSSILFKPQCPFLSPLSLILISLEISPFTFVSHYIIIIILGLGSTNEWEQLVICFSSLGHIFQYNDLHFHSFSCTWDNFVFYFYRLISIYLLYRGFRCDIYICVYHVL
jgi:hypothetical protein